MLLFSLNIRCDKALPGKICKVVTDDGKYIYFVIYFVI